MKKHFFYYLSLLIILGVGFFTSSLLGGQKNYQIMLLVFTGFCYVLWGVIHHVMHHSFSFKIMLEYIAISILGVSLVIFVQNVAL